jgi:hypothetical protein
VSDAFANRERCQAQKKDGSECSAPAVRDGLCVGHQPGDHAAWRRKGGAATSRATRAIAAVPTMLQPVLRILQSALAKVATNEYTPAQGSALASLASAIVKVAAAGEQERRLDELETRLAQYDRDRRRWSA